MLLVLVSVFIGVFVLLFALYPPAQAAILGKALRQKEQVVQQLEEMFIFLAPLPQESVKRLVRIKWTCSFGSALVGLLLTWGGRPPVPIVIAVVLGIGGYFLPELYVVFTRRRRRAAFREQLVDGLVLMANGLRSGLNLPQTIDIVIGEMQPPISQEFKLIRQEFGLGVDLDVAFRKAVARTRDDDFDLAVTAISITRQLGGNLSEAFDRIVSMVRDRKILEGKAAAITAQGRLQALVVGALPYVFGFFLLKINPELMRLMWTTLPGLAALSAVVVLDIVGYLWVRKIASVKY